MSDLIEQLDGAACLAKTGAHRKAIREAIEGLRPVEDEEIANLLRETEREILKERTSEWLGALLRQNHNCIERLARELAGKESAVRRTLHENAELQSQLAEANAQLAKVPNLYTEIESLQAQIAGLKKNIAFYKSCLLSGEIPEDGAEPYT